jgi:Glycosyl hydrolase family 76
VGRPPAYAFRVQTSDTAPEHRYYDDQGWVGLDLLRAYTLTRDSRFLKRAQDVFAFLLSGWQRDPRIGCPGGILWKEPPNNDTRNAVSTLPTAEIALRLYLITHNPRDLRWAKTIDRWARRCLRRRDGLVADHIDRMGKIDTTAWSYNQGNALRVATLLARATHERAPRQRALRIARVGLRQLTAAQFAHEPPIFPAIWWSSLLAQRLPRSLHRRVLRDAQRWADALWDRRDARRGILWTNRTRPPSLNEQAALAQVYAALATDGGRWWRRRR